MKVAYRQASYDDVIRQFRYYLLELNLPEVAIRFKEAVLHGRRDMRRILEQERLAAE